MAQGGIGNQNPATLFQARLDTGLGISNGLKLVPYIGNKVVVSGMTVVVPGTGLQVLNTDNLITATGADSGAPPVAATLYYVYVSNQKAGFSPSSIRLSASPPLTFNGVKYLGNTGNALNWRFVGWVQLDATPDFVSNVTDRLIVNYYNRLLADLLVNPGYVDNNTPTTYSTVSTTFLTLASIIGGGAVSRLSFISNGEDAVEYSATFVAIGSLVNNVPICGIGEDSITQAAESGLGDGAVQNNTLSLGKSKIFSEGMHTLDLLFATNAGTSSFYADLGRIAGGAADSPATQMSASVFV